jgi:hypothetical protein
LYKRGALGRKSGLLEANKTIWPKDIPEVHINLITSELI